jgi:hypothetical protein
MKQNSNLSASTHLNYNEGPVPNYTPENLRSPYAAERDYGGKQRSGEGSCGLFLHTPAPKSILSLGQFQRGGKLTTHLYLVPRSRIEELYLHSPICLPGIVLNSRSTGTIVPQPYTASLRE